MYKYRILSVVCDDGTMLDNPWQVLVLVVISKFLHPSLNLQTAHSIPIFFANQLIPPKNMVTPLHTTKLP